MLVHHPIRWMQSTAAILLLLVAPYAVAQAPPIIGSAPVRITPSTTSPLLGDEFSVDVAIDLSTTSGFVAGTATPAGLSAFRVPISFDRTRVQLLSIAAGTHPAFAAGSLDATDIAAANASGSLTITATALTSSPPAGVVSIAALRFRATSQGNASIAARTGASLASAIHVVSATLYGPAPIPPALVGGGVSVQTQPELRLTATAAPFPVASGAPLTIFATAENTGGSTARNVTVSASLPGDVTILSTSPPATVAGQSLTWSAVDLAAGEQFRVAVSARANGAIGDASDASFTATAANVAGTQTAVAHITVGAKSGLAPGSVLAASSFSASGAIFDVTNGTPVPFATVNSGNWTGPLLITGTGRVLVATNAGGGSIYDITTGGDLRTAPPIAQNLFGASLAWVEGLAIDAAGNLYVSNAEAPGQRLAKVTPEGTVSLLPPLFNYPSGLLVDGNALLVSEGGSGSVKRIDLGSLAVTTFASGFRQATDHFSGQLARDTRGRVFVLWSNAANPSGLFDITAGGDFSAATPVTARGAFRIDVNQFAFDAGNNAWFAGDGTDFVWKSAFSAGTFSPAQPVAGKIADVESIAAYPTPSTANLTTTISATPSPVATGSDLTYTISYLNDGGTTATNVVVTTDIPSGTTFVSASNAGTVAGNTVTWTLPSLASQARGTFTLVVRVNAPAGTQVTNGGATIRASGIGPATSIPVVTSVVPPPVLALTVSGPSSIAAGSFLTYSFSLTNSGGIAATTVAATCTLPAGTSFSSASDGGTNAAGTISWQLGTLAPGATRVFSLTVNVTAAASATITNSGARAMAANAIASTANTVTTIVLPPPIVTLTQIGAPNPTVVGGRINFAIAARNTAATPATNVVITARLPHGGRFIEATASGVFSGGVATWTIPSLAAGATTTVRLCVYANVPAGSSVVSDAVSVAADNSTRFDAAAASVKVLAVPAGFGPGTVLDAHSFAGGNPPIWDITTGTAKQFALVNAEGWIGPLMFGANGHAYAATNARNGALYDITPGGDLSGATPIADNLFNPRGYLEGGTQDTAGNFYITNSEMGAQRIAKIAPSGEVSYLTPVLTNATGLLAVDSTLYVSEGGSGSVKAIDLNTQAVTTFATGFAVARDHFSGQLAISPRGRIYTLWRNGVGHGLYDITSGGSFASALPVTAQNAFRIDVNQIAFDLQGNVYFAGNANNHAYRALFDSSTGTFGTTTVFAMNLGDNESIAIYPTFNLAVSAAASQSTVATGEAVTFTLTYQSDSIVAVGNGVVTAIIPAGTSVQSVSSGGIVNGNTVTWSVGNIAAQATGSVSVTLLVDRPAGSTVTFSGYSITADDRPTATGAPVDVNVTGPAGAALAILATASSGTIVQGGSIAYTLKFDNFNTAAAENVVVTDPLPAGVTFLSASSGGVLQNGAVIWNIGSLAPGAASTVSFAVRADSDPAIINANYTITATGLPAGSGPAVVTQVAPPPAILQVAAAAAPNPATSGETLTYTFHATNTGSSTATAVVLDMTIPTGLAFVSANGGATVSAGTVTWHLGAIAPGASAEVAATFDVTAAGGQTITLSDYGVTSAQTSRVTGASIATNVIAAPPPPPLLVTLAAMPERVLSGELIRYTITVANPADVLAEDVVVVNAIPIGTSVISTDGPATAAAQSIEWSVGTLAPAESKTLGFTVRVVAAAETSIVNEGATATTRGRDAAASGAVTTAVTAAPATLAFTIVAPVSVTSGETMTYALSYANEGPGTVTDAAISDPLPAGTTFVSAPGGTFADGVVTWNLGTLAPGASGSVTLVVTATALPGSTIVNGGSRLTATGAPAVDGNTVNSDVAVPPVVFAGTLTTDKSSYAVPEIVHESASVTYVSGGTGLVTALTATLTTANAAGTVVASAERSIGSLAAGEVVSLAYDWNTTGATTGDYTLTFTVADAAGNVLVHRSVAVRVAAPDGARLTGTIAPTNSPVPAGIALQVHLSVTNDNAVAYAALPLEVAVVDPVTLAVRTSTPLTLAIGAGGTAAADVAIATTGLSAGNYTLWLTTSAGSARLLATSSATITAPAIAVSPTSLTLVAGSTGTLTATITTAPAQSTPLAVTSSAPAIVSVPSTVTIPAGATSVAIPVQAVSIGGPVTITAALGEATASSQVTVVMTGTLTATMTVTQGENVTFGIAITNGGQTALTDASFAVEIRNPATGAVVDVVPFTATVPAGETFTTTRTYNTAALAAPQQYAGDLVFNGTDPRITLATAPFEVLAAAPLRLVATVGGLARVLIWSSCSPGNSGTPCTPVAPPFLTRTLREAGIPYVVVGDEFTFIAKMRTGGFSCAVIDQSHPSEQKIAPEYLADIHGGFGLLFIHSTPDAMPKLSPALATSFHGTLQGPVTVNLLTTPFTTAGTLTLNGNGVAITLAGARAAASTAGGAPAISYNTYGTGRVVVVPFDLEQTPVADVARLILGAVRWISRDVSPSTAAREVVPLRIAVTTPPGGQVPVTVTVTLPSTTSVVDALPPFATTTPLQWSALVAGNTTTLFDVWIRLPDVAGTTTVTIDAGHGAGPPVITKTVDLTVTLDAASMKSQLATELTALKSAALTHKDQKAVERAIAELAGVAASADPIANVQRLLAVMDELQSVSLNTEEARAVADRLFVYWQTRIGA